MVIPQVGELSVNGLTLDGLRSVLFQRLGQAYSGISRDDDATTHFSVTLGRLRTNQVFLIGEVTRPGACQVSSAATLLHALYSAGGPEQAGELKQDPGSAGWPDRQGVRVL